MQEVSMDTEKEWETNILGTGTFMEAFNILLLSKRIFCSITLSLVLPLCFVVLLDDQLTNLIFDEIDRSEEALADRRADGRILGRLASEWASIIAFKGVYLLLVLVLSLLATSAVVYTIACMYTAKDVTFREVLTAVPRVWRRLLVTFLWSSAFLIPYNAAALLILVFCFHLFGTGDEGLAAMGALCLPYNTGLAYIGEVWQLASVASVVEDTYGLAAMQKGKALMKGKTFEACLMFLLFHVSFWCIDLLLLSMQAAVQRGSPGAWPGLMYAAVLLSLMVLLVLLAMVVQTVIYFVCKSNHHESIDKSALAEHLEVYLGAYYVPLKGNEVQLEQCNA